MKVAYPLSKSLGKFWQKKEPNKLDALRQLREAPLSLCVLVRGINALGNALPPAFIFPRANFKEHMLKGAPSQCLGLANSSGWMNNEYFLKVLQHFIDFMKPSKEATTVLFMDNHASHISLDVIDLAVKNNLSIITFPPHCSHKLLPLDVGVFGPFKRYYASYCDAWLTEHAGKPISIYDVAELAGIAFVKSFTIENITSSFRKTGIHPLNPDVFPEHEFLAAAVTDIPLQHDDVNEGEETASTSVAAYSSQQDEVNVLTCSSNTSLIESIKPLPRVAHTTKRSNRRKVKTAILTSTPEKAKLALLQYKQTKKAPQPAAKRRITCATQLSSAVSQLQESSSDDESSESEGLVEEQNPEIIEAGRYVIVKMFPVDGSFKHFVGLLLDGPDEEGDFEIKFMKRSNRIKDGCIFPEVDDLATAKKSDIVQVLSPPSSAATKRLVNVLKFGINLARYGI